ncbi:MAG: hypothetical protein HYZ73_06210 [Elusimicrobia bacterium]|nr:hypothetical protein [Elusimicrobiota bacterium]
MKTRHRSILVGGVTGAILWVTPVLAAVRSEPQSFGPGGGSNLGVGFQVGASSGFSAKYWLGRKRAVQGLLGWRSSGTFQFQFSYLWHDFTVFSIPKEHQLPFYLGVGTRVTSNDPEWGIHGVVGLNYLPAKSPFDIFLEAGPVLVLAPRASGDFDAALGARYYFR